MHFVLSVNKYFFITIYEITMKTKYFLAINKNNNFCNTICHKNKNTNINGGVLIELMIFFLKTHIVIIIFTRNRLHPKKYHFFKKYNSSQNLSLRETSPSYMYFIIKLLLEGWTMQKTLSQGGFGWKLTQFNPMTVGKIYIYDVTNKRCTTITRARDERSCACEPWK